MNPEGEFGEETKDLSRTISEFNSGASNIGAVSLETGKWYKQRPK